MEERTDQEVFRFAPLDPSRLQVEELLFVDRAGGGAVAAPEYVELFDLEDGDGRGLGFVTQEEVAARLIGIATAGRLLDAHCAVPNLARLAGERRLEEEVAHRLRRLMVLKCLVIKMLVGIAKAEAENLRFRALTGKDGIDPGAGEPAAETNGSHGYGSAFFEARADSAETVSGLTPTLDVVEADARISAREDLDCLARDRLAVAIGGGCLADHSYAAAFFGNDEDVVEDRYAGAAAESDVAEGQFDLDAAGHVHYRATGPQARGQRLELPLCRRHQRTEARLNHGRVLPGRRREVAEDDMPIQALGAVGLSRLAAFLLEQAVEDGRIAAAAPAVGMKGDRRSGFVAGVGNVGEGGIEFEAGNVRAPPLLFESRGHRHRVESAQCR